MSATPIDSRLAHLEGAYDQISDRLNSIDNRFESIDRRFDNVDRRFDDLAARIDGKVDGLRDALVSRMDRQFMWLLAIMIVSIILPVVERMTVR